MVLPLILLRFRLWSGTQPRLLSMHIESIRANHSENTARQNGAAMLRINHCSSTNRNSSQTLTIINPFHKRIATLTNVNLCSLGTRTSERYNLVNQPSAYKKSDTLTTVTKNGRHLQTLSTLKQITPASTGSLNTTNSLPARHKSSSQNQCASNTSSNIRKTLTHLFYSLALQP